MRIVRTLSTLIVMLALSAPFAQAADEKKGDNSTAAAIEANERKVNDAFSKGDSKTFLSLLDAAAFMGDARGWTTAAGSVDMMKDMKVTSYVMSDVKVHMIDKDAYFITYSSKGEGTYKGQAIPPGTNYCSTVWAKRGKDWKAIYHQESMAMPSDAAAVAH